MFKRANRPTFYIENTITGEQKSLGTADRETAQRLLNAQNEARHNPTMNLQMGKVYMTNADPKTATRIWQEAMNELCSHGKEVSQTRYPERFAQAALGHASRAVHYAYARKAHVVCPPLENANNKIIPLMQETGIQPNEARSETVAI